MASRRKTLTCDVRAGVEPDGPRCARKATHLGVDDDGQNYYFCAKHMPTFEGGMAQMHTLPGGAT